MAHDINIVADNSTDGIAGSGDLAAGWTAGTAPSTASSCLYMDGDIQCSSTGTTNQRRTLYFSNGNLIWDFDTGDKSELYTSSVSLKNKLIPTAEAAMVPITYGFRCSY